MQHILTCGKCGGYTMKEHCPTCKIKTDNPKPAKYSLDDTYGKYRRKVKEPALKKRGLL